MNKLLLSLAFFALVPLARGVTVTPHSVVAHANDQRFWVARIERFNNADYTVIYYRLLGQDDRWQRLCRMDSAIDDIAASGALAAVLFKDKSWALVYGDGGDGSVVTAGSLPASAQMLALAGSEKGWWAIGQTPGGLPAAAAATRPSRASTRQTPGTRAATQPTSAPTKTISQDSSPTLVLFQLAGNTWMPVAEWTEPLSETPHVALSIIEQIPYVALLDANSLTVAHLDNARWIKDFQSPGFSKAAAFRLLGDVAPPRLWVQQQTGPDLLIPLNRAGSTATSVPAPADIPAKDRDVVIFGRSLRIIGRANDKLIEQRFDVDGSHPQDKPTDLAIPDSSQLLDLQGLHTLIAVMSLTLVLLGWFRQQAASQGVEPHLQEVTLAPIRRRFAAGLIDVSPIFLTMLFFIARHASLPSSVPHSRQFLFFLAYWASGLFYILHTTLIETYAGRSLGKIMLGLRVVTLQGAAPTQSALFTRNALRIFDVSMFFFPVLFIPFSPLRQRSGDLAAGTVVAMDGTPRNDQSPSNHDAT